MTLSEEMREYLFRLSEHEPVTHPEAGWPGAVAALESENAELKKFLKHARDDKKIRLGEIGVLEERNENLRGMVAHLQGQCDRLRKRITASEDHKISEEEAITDWWEQT